MRMRGMQSDSAGVEYTCRNKWRLFYYGSPTEEGPQEYVSD